MNRASKPRAPVSCLLACVAALALLLASSLAAGCAPRAGNAEAGRNASASDTGRVARAAADTLLTLDRSRCFGPCPSYALTVFRDGRVVYVGRHYVEVEDTVRTQISNAKVDRLAEAFRAAGYLDGGANGGSDAACAVRMTDHPTVRTAFWGADGHHRSVAHYHGCYARRTEGGGLERAPARARLAALEDTVDALVGTARWTGE